MAVTADHLIVIGRGKLIADTSVEEFVRLASGLVVHVRTPDAPRLREVVSLDGVRITSPEPNVLEIEGLTPEQVGELAAEHRIVLHGLSKRQASLEEAFMHLTRDDVEFKALEREEAAA
jgi:ABC-2 type transport system ATP-binding protein